VAASRIVAAGQNHGKLLRTDDFITQRSTIPHVSGQRLVVPRRRNENQAFPVFGEQPA
jgi:hypothetical protein